MMNDSLISVVMSVYNGEKFIFNRKKIKNKLILRKILKKEIGLDSDKIGKMGFSYDSKSLVQNNWNFMKNEIFKNQYWDRNAIKKILTKLEHNKNSTKRKSGTGSNIFYRLYLLSTWLNNNKYTNK